jgi:hypothetical protein
LSDVAAKLNIKSMEDWYKVPARKVQQNGGAGLLSHFNDSLRKGKRFEYLIDLCVALVSADPDYNWDMSKFRQQVAQNPNGYWTSLATQRQFFDQLALKLGIKKQEDWYKITREQVEANGGRGLLNRYGFALDRGKLTLHS